MRAARIAGAAAAVARVRVLREHKPGRAERVKIRYRVPTRPVLRGRRRSSAAERDRGDPVAHGGELQTVQDASRLQLVEEARLR